MEALADNSNDEISIPYLEEVTGIPKSTVYQHIYKLEKEGVVKKTSRIRRGSKDTQLYQLNMNDDRAKLVVILESFLVSEYMANIIRERGERTLFEEIKISTMLSQKRQLESVTTAEPELVLNWEDAFSPQPQPQPQLPIPTANQTFEST